MTPRPYQIVGRDFLAGRRHALLADQMRVGKTPQAILAADHVGAQRVLVLCPAIATEQWAAEWARWSPERRPAVIAGPTLSDAALDGARSVLVASYDRARIAAPVLLDAEPWDLVVADEAHFAKTPTTQRTRLVYGKGGLGHRATRLWALTGTPAPNHAGELWAMLRAFGATKLAHQEFLNHFCNVNRFTGMILGNKPARLPELRAMTEPFTLRRTLLDVAPDLEPIEYSIRLISGPKTADFVSDEPERITENERVNVALAKVPHLADEVQEQLTAGNYSQTVVFGFHVNPLRLLTDRLCRQGVTAEMISGATPDTERHAIIARCRVGLTQVLVAQLIAAGTAIDLSFCTHGYFLELDWNPANNSQAAHRLVSLLTMSPVTFDVLTWPQSVDYAVHRTLLRKTKDAVFAM
jgi:SNF2 family DNA or RNA helicase